ncbi:MAG: HNH endonuclease [Pseudomonadota bacterium]
MMAVPNSRIEELLLARGYRSVHKTQKKQGFQKGTDTPVYLNLTTSSGETALVLHPDQPVQELTKGLGCVVISDGYYHSSNMKLFPKRMHTGANPVGYGWGLTFESEAAAQKLLDRLEQDRASAEAVTRDDPDPSSGMVLGKHRPGSDRIALAKRRIGQGEFREAMLGYWTTCAVTGLRTPQLLRASHIKPWKVAEPEEKTDPFNGLLLAANLDAAFDAGLISFKDNGTLLISSQLQHEDRVALRIDASTRLREIDAGHLPYLQFHRSKIFLA